MLKKNYRGDINEHCKITASCEGSYSNIFIRPQQCGLIYCVKMRNVSGKNLDLLFLVCTVLVQGDFDLVCLGYFQNSLNKFSCFSNVKK